VYGSLIHDMTKRRLRNLAFGLIAGATLVARLWFQWVPRGVGFFPYLLASTAPQVVAAPAGASELTVIFNDAGAAHSGNFWTWVVAEDWLRGKHVVAEGYSETGVRYGDEKFPLEWSKDGRFVARFVAGRRSNEYVYVDGPP